MTDKEKHIAFCNYAESFLREKLTQKGIDSQIVDEYLNVPLSENLTISAVYYQMLFSAQNRVMAGNVIGGAVGGVERLGEVLCGFDPHEVQREFCGSPALVKDRIIASFPKILGDNGEVGKLWNVYCKSVVSAADFLAQFADGKDFVCYVHRFYDDDRARDALPCYIGMKVDGFGVALACDFLKELGFTKFGKPDVHIRKILTAYGFVCETDTDLAVLETIVKIADDAGVTPYKLDKVLWLIGSGYFYKHRTTVGRNGKVGTMRDSFINKSKDFLGKKE